MQQSQQVGDERGAEGKEGWKVGVRSQRAEPQAENIQRLVRVRVTEKRRTW